MTIQAVVPSEKVIYYFWAIITFKSEETHSLYVKDQRYCVRDGNDKLDALVKYWMNKGKVSLEAPMTIPLVAKEKKPWWRRWL